MIEFSPVSGAERLATQRQILETLTRIGASVILALVVFKASVALVAFPGWDMDPMSMSAPLVGLGPTATLAIDCSLLTLGGAVIALSAPLVGRFPAVELLLFLAGTGAVLWHGLFSPNASQEHLLTGIGWAAAMSVAVSLAHAARLDSVRRIGAAVAIGFLAVLAIKGAMQVFDETPQTIAAYKQNREAILASHGWSPDSFAARTFERRLYDAAATGWFGLSNVVATFGAAGLAVFTVLLVREPGRKVRLLALIGLLAALACLWLAGSKGGWVAAGTGLAIGIAGAWIVGKSRFAGALLVIAVPIAAISAVVARGVIGERIGELSLLFRSQYLAAAAKIFVQHPVTGVGPAGFKDAYLLAKSPVSPEEVSSPHSVLFDFASTLGIGGVAWGVLVLSLLALAGANLARVELEEEQAESADNTRNAFRLSALSLAGATIGSAWVETAIATPLGGIVRIASLALALLLAWRICDSRARALRIALVAGAAASGFHAMIEVTPVQSGSGALFAALIGLAAAQPWEASLQVQKGVLKRAIPGLFIAVLGIACSILIDRVQRWEGFLIAGASRLEPITTLSQEIAESSDPDRVKSAAAELSRAVGRPVPENAEAVRKALLEARRTAGARAYEDLIMAIAADPTSQSTRQAASNLSLQLAALDRALAETNSLPGPEYARRLRSASELAEDATRLPWHRASAEAWLATVRRGIWELTHDSAALEGAFRASVNAATLDPHNPLHAAATARLAQAMGNGAAASEWAMRALRLDQNMRLDPLRRLEARERTELEGLSRAWR
ncbi:MAG: O-antigen ligase family protein [Phycisphaeraceae bacterium]|nr:O-antigen ligase family protein [Phycisphaeraceae bacterium]